MKMTRHRELWGDTYYKGRKNGFKFDIILPLHDKGVYFVVEHKDKDIRYNSLWENKKFKTKEDAFVYCEKWTPKGHCCIGVDFKKG